MQFETKQLGKWSNSFAVVCLTLILGFASASYGDIIISSWENSLDGWETFDANTQATPGMSQGVTLGNYSLEMSNVDGWQQALVKSWGDWWQLTPFENATTFSIDVTLIASEWSMTDTDAQWGIKPLENVVMAGPSNWWEQLNPVTQPDFSGDGSRLGVWKPVDGDKTVTYTFNIPARGSDLFVQMTLVTNRGTADTAGLIYFDSARLITPGLDVTKCKVAAGKTQYHGDEDFNNMKDSFTASGNIVLPDDCNDVTEVVVTLTNDDDEVIYTETLADFNASVVNSTGKYKYSAKAIKGQAGNITSLKLDFTKGTFLVQAKNINLKGLTAPFELKFGVGTLEQKADVDESIINGASKRIPTRLMRQYDDKLVVTKAVAKHKTTALTDTLNLRGEIAVWDMNLEANEPNLVNEDVTLTWGDINDANTRTFIIPAGSFKASKKGHVYKCAKVECDANDGNEAFVTATFDLDKCTFFANINKAEDVYADRLSQAVLSVSFATEQGTFNEEDEWLIP